MHDRIQDCIQVLSDCALSGDYHRFRQGVDLPMLYATENSTHVISTEEEMRHNFDVFAGMCRANRIATLRRVLLSAQAVGSVVTAFYEARYLGAAGEPLFPPSQGVMLLRDSGGVPRLFAMVTSLKNEEWPLLKPQS